MCGWQSLRFFFSRRRRHTRFSRDWSSDVCSSDLSNQWGGVKLALVYQYMMNRYTSASLTPPHWFEASAQWTLWACQLPLTNGPKIRKVTRSEERRVGKARKSRWRPQNKDTTKGRD